MKILFILICVFASYAGQAQNNKFRYNDLKKNSAPIGFDRLGYKINYVALETTMESIIPDIWSVKFDDKYIFVLSAKGGVFQFDRNGKFVRKISAQGNGPQEYAMLQDIALNSETNKIYLYDYSGKLLVYNYEGKFLAKYTLGKYLFCKALINNDNEFLITAYNYMGTKSAQLYEHGLKEGTVHPVGTAITFKPESPQVAMYTITKAIFNTGGQIIVHPNFSNIVYTYDPKNKTLSERYSFQFDAPFYPDLLGKGFDGLGKSQAVTDISEDGKYIFATIADGGSANRRLYLIDKKSGKSYLPDLKYSNGFRSTFKPRYQYKNQLADILQVESLGYPQGVHATDEEIESAIRFFSEKTGSKLSIESNPVLIIIEKQ